MLGYYEEFVRGSNALHVHVHFIVKFFTLMKFLQDVKFLNKVNEAIAKCIL